MNRKDMPTTYEELREVVGDGSRTICNNTTATMESDGQYGIRLHGHLIALVGQNSVSVRHCGYVTATTFDRLHRFLPWGWNCTRQGGYPRVFRWGAGTERRDEQPIRDYEWITLY